MNRVATPASVWNVSESKETPPPSEAAPAGQPPAETEQNPPADSEQSPPVASDGTPAETKRALIPLKEAKGAWSAIGALFLLGTIAFTMRFIMSSRNGGVAQGDTVWKLICSVSFEAKAENTIVRAAIPGDTKHIRVFGQDFNTPGLRMNRTRGRGGFRRDAVGTTYRKGTTSADFEYDLHLSPNPGWREPNGNGVALPTEDAARLLKAEPSIQVTHELVIKTLRPLQQAAPQQSKLVVKIYDYCREQIAFDPESDNEDAVETLEEKEGGAIGRARAMVALCRAARIHARTVGGFVLEEKPTTDRRVWCEVYLNKRWIPYDLEFGHAGKLPMNYFPVRRGGVEIIRVGERDKDDAENIHITYTLTRQPVPRGMRGGNRSFLEIFDLRRLPLVTQLSLATLLLLPFGALLTTVFRNFGGVRTFGTFSPTLLALAAFNVEWKTVAVIFVLVIIIGVGGRAMLPGFKLMQVPRLSIVFTLVAVSMMLAVSILDYFGLNPTGHIALLPMVVLTSLVDRIYTVSDDDGLRVAAVRLMWTAIVGVLCFGMFLFKPAGVFVLNYPEVHFFTIGLMLLFGLYAGRKLSDFRYFAWLTEPKSEKKDGEGEEKSKKKESEDDAA